jgi:hypothetical protein
VESRTSPTGPAWDIRLELADGLIQLRECKDTKISKEDREVFYRRVRKELAAGTLPNRLSAGWVMDRDKQPGQMLSHLKAMKRLAEQSNGIVIPSEPPQRVSSAEKAIQEALYYLAKPCICNEARCVCKAPCSLDDACKVLAGLEVDCWRADDLSASVQLLAENVFTGGTGAAIWRYVCGELTERICGQGHAEYTTESFLSAVQTGPLALTASGLLKDLLVFNSAAGHRPTIPALAWRRLAGEPTNVWPLRERLPELQGSRSCVVMAQVGVGKSVTSQQAFEEAIRCRDPHHVLRVEAGDIDEAHLDALLQLTCVLSGIAPTWLAVDGLDEISRNNCTGWQRTVRRLLSVPNLTLLLTAREEVVAAHQWLQKITDTVAPVTLPRLSIEQVRGAFEEVGLPVPTSGSLIEVLRTAFLFSLYAGVVTPSDLPLADSGEVTAFQVIETFWRRAVLAESVGHRLVGDEQRSQQAKRDALAYLVDQTVAGHISISRLNVAGRVSDGIEMLVREGALLEGGQSVQWMHDWLREYALVDYVVSRVSNSSIPELAAAIVAISVDHVARTAAVAGLKWMAAHVEWGTAETYICQLWGRQQGFARDAMAVAIEGSPDLLALEALPKPLLLEAIEQATVLRASQWEEQIMTLPIALFTGNDASDLHRAITNYAVEVARS